MRPKRRILNVEDQPLLQRILRDFLMWQGFEVVQALDGAQAIRFAESERPDLILMDIQLPGVSGIEATRAIKANQALAHIPIIAVTGFALPDDERMCRDAGCDDFLTKPYDLDVLLKKLHAFIQP